MSNQQKQDSRQQHDSLFKEVMEHPGVARDFMAAWMPQELKDLCDFRTVRSEPASFKNTRQDLICDTLYSIRAKDSDERLYVIIEHQSSADPDMVQRISNYKLSAYERYRENYYHFPEIVPLVLYHGERTPYPYPVSATGAFNLPTAHPAFRLADLTVMEDKLLMTHGRAAAMEMALKHAYRQYPDVAQAVQFLTDMQSLQDQYGKEGESYVLTCQHYWLYYNKSVDIIGLDEIKNHLPDNRKKERIMLQLNNYSQQLLQRGEHIGVQKGKLEVAQKMINRGIPYETVMELTELAPDKIAALKKHGQ